MLKAFGNYVRQHHLALVALIVALSGTTYAASRDVGRDSAKKHRASCSQGLKHAGDVCYGGTQARKFPEQAGAVCAKKGQRLADVSEARLILRHLHSNQPIQYWTSDHTGTSFDNPETVQVIDKQPSGEVTTFPIDVGNMQHFRCVVSARR